MAESYCSFVRMPFFEGYLLVFFRTNSLRLDSPFSLTKKPISPECGHNDQSFAGLFPGFGCHFLRRAPEQGGTGTGVFFWGTHMYGSGISSLQRTNHLSASARQLQAERDKALGLIGNLPPHLAPGQCDASPRCGWTNSCTTLNPWQAIVCWYL